MSLKFKFYRNTDGIFTADLPPKYEILGEFLISDIQGDSNLARRVLDRVLDVKTGKTKQWEMTGAAYFTTVTKDKVVILGQWEKGVRLESSVEDFVTAVTGWLAFLESPRS